MSVPFQIRIQAAVAKLLYALPRPVRRLIAGQPIRLDGQELALDAQLFLRMQQLSGSSLISETVEAPEPTLMSRGIWSAASR